MISRTAVSGSSSRRSTASSTRWSSGSSATAASRCDFARLEATANTSRERFRRRRSSSLPSRSSAARCSSSFVPELGHVLAVQRLGQDDRRPLGRIGEPDDRANLVQHRLRRRVIHLVDGDHVRDLHDPGLQRLHGVARAGHEHEQHRVRDARHLDLALPGADRLDEDHVLPERVQQEHGLERRLGKPAEVPARAHRADEDPGIEEVVGETDAIAEERSARERAGRIDRDDADRAVAGAQMLDERADQRRLPHSGRPGDADHDGLPRLRIELANERIRERVAVLDQGDRPRERAPVSRSHAARQLVERPLPPAPRRATLCGASGRPTCARASASLSRRTSISSSRTAIRSSPAAAEPSRAAAGAGVCTTTGGLSPDTVERDRARPRPPRRRPRAGDRRRRSAPEASASRGARRRRRRRRSPPREHHPARADPVGESTRGPHREPEDQVVRAHDRRERAPSEPVRRAALHEDLVADDRRAVPGRASDHERHRDPDRRLSAAPPQPNAISAIEPA